MVSFRERRHVVPTTHSPAGQTDQGGGQYPGPRFSDDTNALPATEVEQIVAVANDLFLHFELNGWNWAG